MRFGTGYMVYLNHPDDAKTLFNADYELHKRISFDISLVTAERLNVTKGLVVL